MRLDSLSVAVVVAAVLGAHEVRAQVVAHSGSATAIVSARLEVGARLRVEPLGSPVELAHHRTASDIGVSAAVSANASWTLSIVAPTEEALRDIIAIRDASGEWQRPLPDVPVVLVRRGGPVNAAPVQIQLRIRSGAPTDLIAALKLVLVCAE